MGPVAAMLSNGARLHLQHGPIDLIIGADGDRAGAFAAARERFETILDELVTELAILRAPLTAGSVPPKGKIARQMHDAAIPFVRTGYLTAMAAVAGAVAQTVLAAMTQKAELSRAYVNNGGDIALHLTKGQRFKMAVARHDGCRLGDIDIGFDDPVRGIATSGRHGRSLSLGIADSVTVLARTAAVADVSATLISNAVDLPGHPAIKREAAHVLDESSDLSSQKVVTGCAALSRTDALKAVKNGEARAQQFIDAGQVHAAFLALGTQTSIVGNSRSALSKGSLQNA